VDVRTLGADVVTGGTVKYLLGSAGLAFMWLRESLRSELLPTQTGWFADEDIFAMSISDYSPHASARRFDSGTPPVPSLYPGVAGIELVAEVGVPAIESHVAGLVERLVAGLDELGATIATPRAAAEHGPLICVVATDPNALVEALAAQRIVTSTRDSNLRISLHLYNVEEDVDRVLDALASNRELLA
jgi:selenocysteine lyase/cysteine desulfurase